MVAALLESAVQPTAAKVVDHLVLMTFDQGKTLILELGDTEDPQTYQPTILFDNELRYVKRMSVGRLRRIKIEI